MKKLIFMGILSILFTGCSTSPVNSNQTAMIPESRMLDSGYFKRKSEDQTKVTFLRDKGFLGSACTHDIYANNIKIFSIRSNEKAVIYLKPDYYIFRLETGGGMCPNIATSQEAEMKPNAEVEYRILVPSDFNLRLTRIK